MLNASGVTQGHVVRPSDRQTPKRIVFVQCVGSRGEGGRPYCSRYCCMNTVKSAMLAHEHEKDIDECVLLYTDMRAAGRGYDAFVARGLGRDDIRHVRGRPAKVQEDPETGDLKLWVEDFRTGRPEVLEAGMVVLSTAALPALGSPELAEILGVDLDEFGFLSVPDELKNPFGTSREGVFGCGFCHSPMDVPDSVVRASAAASKVAEILAQNP